MRGRLVAGNWKSNGNLAANQRLLDAVRAQSAPLRGVACIVCVPYPYLVQAQQTLAGSNVAWGGQDVSQYEAGAYTGAVTAAMLSEFGCRYVTGRAFRTAQFVRRGRCGGCGKIRHRAQSGVDAHFVRRRNAAGTRDGSYGSSRRQTTRCSDRKVRRRVHWPERWLRTNRCGRSAPARPRRPNRRRRCMRLSAGALQRVTRRLRRHCRILYGGSVKAANAQAVVCAAGHRRRPDRRRIAGGRGISGNLPGGGTPIK